jgi:hypothetical protein
MSYTIIYDRRFIRTTRGIIPVILSGSNNCTEYVNNREVLERDWDVYNRRLLELPEGAFMGEIHSMFDGCESEVFKWHARWVEGKNVISWFQNGINSAMTIEEYVKNNPGQGLTCRLSIWSRGDTYEHSEELTKYYVYTTHDLEEWLDAAYARRDELTDKDVYVVIGFVGRLPLKSKPVMKYAGTVAVKIRNQYVKDFEKDKSISFSPNPADAIIFSNIEDAREKIGYHWKNMRFVKAATAFTNKPYVIIVSGGLRNGAYVQKRTKNTLHFSCNADSAMHFVSEKNALRYIDELKKHYSEKKIGTFAVTNA